MKIYLDVSALANRRLTGIGICTQEFVKAAQQYLPCKNFPAIPWFRWNKIGRVRSHLPQEFPVRMWLPWVWNVFRDEPVIYHGLDFRIPREGGARLKKVVTVYDIVEFDETFQSENFLREARRNFTRMLEESQPDAIVCISEFTRQRLLTHFPQWQAVTHVVYLGCDHISLEKKSSAPMVDPYILYVGTLEKRKNVSRILQAFAILNRCFPDLHLVLIGGEGFGYDAIAQTMAQHPAQQKIHALGYLEAQQIQVYWQHAKAFVFPSLYEGFGMPILESMRMGCPVVTSAHGAMCEVAGDAALLAEAENPESIAAEIKKILEDPSLSQTLRQKGFARSAQFNWRKTLEEYALLYNKLFADV